MGVTKRFASEEYVIAAEAIDMSTGSGTLPGIEKIVQKIKEQIQ